MVSYRDVFRRLKVEMNGAVSQSMREGGVNYGMNYGVSLTTIKSIAKEYFPNHALAADLWRQEVRELKLAAIFIEDPASVTAQQMQSWGNDFSTNEIAQVSAMNLWWQCQCALAVCKEWFAGDCTLRHLAACHTIGRMAANLTINDAKYFINSKANAYILREIYRHHPTLQPDIRQISTNIVDLEWQLDEIDYEK